MYVPRHPIQEARERGHRQGLLQAEELADGSRDEGAQNQVTLIRSDAPASSQNSTETIAPPAAPCVAPVDESNEREGNSSVISESVPSASAQIAGNDDTANVAGSGQGQESETDDGRVCVIDLEPFRSGDVLIRLPCMHVFHRDCILPFLKRTAQPKCPFDRAPVNRAQIDELPVWTKK